MGIVGHRPHRLREAEPEALTAAVDQVLSIVDEAVTHASGRDYDSDVPAILRAISSLAEGADRTVARSALDRGFTLHCPLPFARAEVENDFRPPTSREKGSLETFRDLLNDPRTSQIELDGLRSDENAAYAAAARFTVRQSDLLIVVWDGDETHRVGGTFDSLSDARALGVPIVWIDARPPHTWRLIVDGDVLDTRRAATDSPEGSEAEAKRVRATIRQTLVAPPGDDKDWQRYLEEARPRFSKSVAWKAFRDLFGDRTLPRVSFRVPDFEATTAGKWNRQSGEPPDDTSGAVLPYFAWADGLAEVYANRYRSAFVLVFLLGAFAVAMALLPVGLQFYPHSISETLCIALELAAIVSIICLVQLGRSRKWHERWIDYRFAAELLRHLRMVAALGGTCPFPTLAAHKVTYGRPGATWMAWYARAVQRSLELPTGRLDNPRLASGLLRTARLVEEQIEFHRQARERAHHTESALHKSGLLLFGLTLLCCVLHLAPALSHRLDMGLVVAYGLTFLCGFLPALGAALAGIAHQGEFVRVAKRAKAMSEQLAEQKALVEQLARVAHEADPADPGARQISPSALEVTNGAAMMMLGEVLDWRVVFLDQPLRPPA